MEVQLRAAIAYWIGSRIKGSLFLFRSFPFFAAFTLLSNLWYHKTHFYHRRLRAAVVRMRLRKRGSKTELWNCTFLVDRKVSLYCVDCTLFISWYTGLQLTNELQIALQNWSIERIDARDYQKDFHGLVS